MIEECLKILGQKIQGDISDDKMHNVIRSKKMAAETAEWGAKEIDRLEEELDIDPTSKGKVITNFAEKIAQ